MWHSKRNAVIIAAVGLTLLIWNLINLSSFNTQRAEKEALLNDGADITSGIHMKDTPLPPGRIFIDEAISLQKRECRRLEEELGEKFTANIFTIPEYLTLKSSGNDPKVFFDACSSDVLAHLHKKANLHGFERRVDLHFPKADAETLNENVSMLYLIRRVLDEAINSGLKSLDSMFQAPKELVRSEKGGFQFEVFTVKMAFTGRARDIFDFVDRMQTAEPGNPDKQRVFLQNIAITGGEKGTAAEMEFKLIAFKGRDKTYKKPEASSKPGPHPKVPAGGSGTKPAVPLGI